MRSRRLKHWEDWVIGLLGAWFAASPWFLQYQDHRVATMTSVVLGLALTAAAAASILRPGGWQRWLAMAVVAMAAVAPWLFGFAGERIAAWNVEAVGLLGIVLVLWRAARESDARGRKPSFDTRS